MTWLKIPFINKMVVVVNDGVADYTSHRLYNFNNILLKYKCLNIYFNCCSSLSAFSIFVSAQAN